MKTVLLFFFILSINAFSHPLDLGFLQINANQKIIEVSLELNPTAAAEFAKIMSPLSSQDTVAFHHDKLFLSTFGTSQIQFGNTSCLWLSSKAEWINDQQIKIIGLAKCPEIASENFQLELPFIKNASPIFQILGKILIAESEYSFVVESKNPFVNITHNKKSEKGLLAFITMGIEHIGAAPSQWLDSKGFHLPDGIDHILFLLALIIGGGAFWNVVKTTSGFTLGHSITLALGAFGWIHLPEKFVELAIALSIIYVAYEALFHKTSQRQKNKWKAATLFGLVHGLGFARALGELNLSQRSMLRALFGFNIGAEMGQIFIIAICFPLLLLSAKKPLFYRFATHGSASAIGIAGGYWFFIRAFG